jgi:hypothetical protein
MIAPFYVGKNHRPGTGAALFAAAPVPELC